MFVSAKQIRQLDFAVDSSWLTKQRMQGARRGTSLEQEASLIQFYPVMARHQVEGSKLWEFAVYIVFASGYTVNTMCTAHCVWFACVAWSNWHKFTRPRTHIARHGQMLGDPSRFLFSDNTCPCDCARKKGQNIRISPLSLSNVHQSPRKCSHALQYEF